MFSEYIRTFLEQLSIFDCDSLKTLVAVRACSKERNANCKKERRSKLRFPYFSSQSGIYLMGLRDYGGSEGDIYNYRRKFSHELGRSYMKFTLDSLERQWRSFSSNRKTSTLNTARDLCRKDSATLCRDDKSRGTVEPLYIDASRKQLRLSPFIRRVTWLLRQLFAIV